MLPLRSNRKPQLLPIKQLLMKQRKENSLAEEHNMNTDDYLLWKSEQEPNEEKSLSFRQNRNQTLSEDKRFERTKQDVFLQGEAGLWDSDEADDSLRNQLETLNNLQYYDYENASLRGNSDKIRTRKKSATTATQAKKDNDLVKRMIATLDLPIKESIDDMQYNLSILLEKKIREEISTLKKSDFLHEVYVKITSIFEKLQEFEKLHQQEFLNLKSKLLNRLDSVTVNQTGSSEDLQKMEEKICEQITQNFRRTVESLEGQIKDLNVRHESHEIGAVAKYEIFFHENKEKIEELNAKIESLRKETNKILKLVTDTRQQNIYTKPIINVAPRRSVSKEPSFKIGDINSSNFYRDVDAELEQHRRIYINHNFTVDQYQATPALFTINDNKWKP